MRVLQKPAEGLGVVRGRLRQVLGESAVRIVPRRGVRGGYVVLFGPVFPGPAVVQERGDVLFAGPIQLMSEEVRPVLLAAMAG